MRKDIHKNHKCLSTVVLFLKYKWATSYRNTSGYDHHHPHDVTPCACAMIFMETTNIWRLSFYSPSISVPLPTVTRLDMTTTTHTTGHPARAQWYWLKPQAFGFCRSIPQVWVCHFLEITTHTKLNTLCLRDSVQTFGYGCSVLQLQVCHFLPLLHLDRKMNFETLDT